MKKVIRPKPVLQVDYLLRDYLCNPEWVSEDVNQSRTLRADLLLRGESLEKPLSTLWDNLPENLTFNDPVGVLVEKSSIYVNKELFNETPLLSFPVQNQELSKEINEPHYNVWKLFLENVFQKHKGYTFGEESMYFLR